MMPSLITANASHQTLPVVQNVFAGSLSANYNVAMASYLLAMAPSIIGYLFAQRFVISGVMRGAVK
jgi:raffinose/stachyose/melibiose transport system permease protein